MGSFRSVAALKWLDGQGLRGTDSVLLRYLRSRCAIVALVCNGLARHSTLVSTTPQSGHPS
ncbi:uncharacterized protein CTRU02_200397 [Colletotrichum truncatum]|uniref:Uncharacterized protein n=1 Tax=Colletotrichum truncatum TaxID=5467 RepID=A0ACC3ZEI9_COLTU|nr:uncharacterized protein CTRU02_00156 [Colletotrichum truncatum]KAF6801407.1 hypothetical protein CTRU02_00156 [Colletotrichum truncatum]